MAGHSKSSNIKHRKNAQDAKRSRLFTKLTREILVAARENPNAAQNPRLRLAKEKALGLNIKKETIEKIIKKVTTSNNGATTTIRYEGYGPSGIAILIDTSTDNRNRTASDVRFVLTRHGGNLGTTGSVARLFDQQGIIQLVDYSNNESEMMELALAMNAEDIIFSPTQAFSAKFIVSKEKLEASVAQLERDRIAIEDAAVSWLPKDRALITEASVLDKLLSCIESLEALPDVDAVYTSCDWQLE